jgi:hypothetical protein
MQTTSQKITARHYEKLPHGSPFQLLGGEIGFGRCRAIKYIKRNLIISIKIIMGV